MCAVPVAVIRAQTIGDDAEAGTDTPDEFSVTGAEPCVNNVGMDARSVRIVGVACGERQAVLIQSVKAPGGRRLDGCDGRIEHIVVMQAYHSILLNPRNVWIAQQLLDCIGRQGSREAFNRGFVCIEERAAIRQGDPLCERIHGNGLTVGRHGALRRGPEQNNILSHNDILAVRHRAHRVRGQRARDHGQKDALVKDWAGRLYERCVLRQGMLLINEDTRSSESGQNEQSRSHKHAAHRNGGGDSHSAYSFSRPWGGESAFGWLRRTGDCRI